MSVSEDLNQIIDDLAAHVEDVDKIDNLSHGWKSVGKRLRKATLTAEKALKALRQKSMDIEKAN
jgi:hypothetical protein